MTHTDIINFLIKNRHYSSYLEIGLSEPNDNFTKILCENKESVDPYLNESNEYDSKVSKDNLPDNVRECLTYLMTSDEMFEILPKDKKYDLIFIDGLHTEEQCCKDIVNSMKHLNKYGCIVVHDTIPINEETQKRVRESSAWNGDVWKSIVKLNRTNLKFKTVNADCGVTVIEYEEFPNYGDYLLDSGLDYKNDFSLNDLHTILESDVELAFAGTSVIESNIPVNLIAHFYIPSWYDRFPDFYKIHFKCIEKYANIFTNVVFVLTVDENIDNRIIQEYREKILKIGFNGDISIKIRKNDAYREARTFNDEIVQKLDELKGLTFFVHGKGISNIGRNDINENQIYDWVISSYFQMFDNFHDIVFKLINGNTGICYGSFLFNHEFCLTKNKWYYSGSFQCINTKKLCNYIKANNIHIPELCDRAYAETFLGDIIEFSTFRCRSFMDKYAISTPMTMYSNADSAAKFFAGNNFEKYKNFKNKILNDYKN